MLSWRLLLATGESRFADLAERTLFNVVATSPAPDGRSFFYANPLHQRVPGAIPDPNEVSHRASSSLREPWFAVSCCPTNIARTFASLAAYLATVDDGGLQIHQYADSKVSATLTDGRRVGVEVNTGYPEEGTIVIDITESDEAPWALTLRVPQWAAGATLTENGSTRAVSPGSVIVERTLAAGDRIELELPLTPRWTFPDPRIDSIRGTAAVERGPLVLCLESVDLPGGANVDTVRVDAGTELVEGDGAVTATGRLVGFEEDDWPYDDSAEAASSEEEIAIALTPYHDWANRGPSTMRVWIPVR
jgi:DUF1680 family protein